MKLRDGHLVIYTGPHWCHILNFMASLGGIEFFTGGAPIALMRLLFIKYPSKVQFSQETISALITLATTTLTVWVVYVWTTTPKLNPDLADMCLGIGHELHTTLFHYTSDHSLVYDLRIVAFSLMGLAGIFVISEIFMYISIFWFLTKHDKEMVLVLPKNTVKKRLQKNAVHLSCHAAACLVKLLWLVIICTSFYGIKHLPEDYRVLARCFYMSIDGVLSAVNIRLSTPIRTDFLAICQSISKPIEKIWTTRTNRGPIEVPSTKQSQELRVQNQESNSLK